QQASLIHLSLVRPILNPCQNVGVKDIVADIVHGAVTGALAVVAAMVVSIGLFVLLVHAKRQRPAAVCTLHQPGKDLCRTVFLLAAARLNQLLHPVKDVLTDKGFMGIFHTNPFLFRLADLFLVLIGDIGLLVVDAVANIGFIFQDAFDLRNRPEIGRAHV